MVLSLMQLELKISESHLLKDKRMVIKSIKDRVRSNFNVSISEIGSHDLWARADFGVAFVGTDTKFANKVLSGVVEYIQKFPQVQIIDYCIEML